MTKPSSKLPISVFIVCQDEEQHIARCLQSCERMQEIVLVDSGSSDKTLEIANQYPVKILHNAWPGYAKQKQFALEQCTQDWVLNLDADEELTPELVNEFEKFMQQGQYSGLRCLREDLFLGQRPSKWAKKSNNLRFYKRSKVAFDENTLVHETAELDGVEARTAKSFLHHGYDEIESVIDKHNLYSSLKASEKYQKGKRFSYLKLILIYPLTFLKIYILQRNIFSGMRGFILANNVAYYSFLKESKLYELEIRQKNNS